MHQSAAHWDKINADKATAHVVQEGKRLPVDRPCDWCGEPVPVGFIHKDCAKKEQAFWFDLIY